MSKPKTKMMDVRDVARLMESRKPQTKKMHKAALRVLANYQSTGEPFALFLSSWSFDHARKRFLSLLEEVWHWSSPFVLELTEALFTSCERFHEAYYARRSPPILTRASGFLAHITVAV
jgi:hypothetical protein